MEEKELYTPEQLEKLQKLRALSEAERMTKKAIIENTQKYESFLKIEVGDKIFFKGKRGVVIEKIKAKKRSKFDSISCNYTVKCGIEVFKNVDRYSLQKRIVENYDDVEVCEKIKNTNTKELLSWYRGVAYGHYYPEYHVDLPPNLEIQLKAELSRREHIPDKKEGKFYRSKKK